MRSFVHILIYLVVLGCQVVLVLISTHVQLLCKLLDSLLVWEYKENMDLKQNLLVPYWTSLSTYIFTPRSFQPRCLFSLVPSQGREEMWFKGTHFVNSIYRHLFPWILLGLVQVFILPYGKSKEMTDRLQGWTQVVFFKEMSFAVLSSEVYLWDPFVCILLGEENLRGAKFLV